MTESFSMPPFPDPRPPIPAPSGLRLTAYGLRLFDHLLKYDPRDQALIEHLPVSAQSAGPTCSTAPAYRSPHAVSDDGWFPSL